ncbi:MAG TPA: erythromycin esterase family protein [Noviherbaspirillum sp.]|jgi:erythromycin esterase-like protein|uniref:erythromycin esterase family protein n=1 Tax=Noviherbaspirillum sp. TaxID=1926288 RepID=UPI002F935CA1
MENRNTSQAALDAVRNAARPLRHETDIDSVLDEIGDARIVLLGEATHGSREFYRFRAELTKQLIIRKGFDALAVEADWPDALLVNRYIQSPAAPAKGAKDVRGALAGFERFPQWMWRNTEIAALVQWLRQHNLQYAAGDGKVGFFGLDLYSLHRSMESVVRYLSRVDPEAARQARARYACFDHLAEDPQRYGYAANFGMRKDCEDEVIRQLVALTEEGGQYVRGDGAAADELFYAQQNARVAQNAEAYYRSMFQGRNASWNLRDTHMAETLSALQTHLMASRGRPARIVVWAHNSHIGDASVTEMGDDGQLNLGQLVREQLGRETTFLLGFSTHAGTVTAASEWDSPAERKTVRPSHPDSFERLFHDAGINNFFLPLRRAQAARDALRERRLERAIGVIYLPESERFSHYFEAALGDQFDALVHFDETHALEPLERTAALHDGEAPETWPTGI